MWNDSKEAFSSGKLDGCLQMTDCTCLRDGSGVVEERLTALKQVEARNAFAEGVKKKKVKISEEKRLEILIKADKLTNPMKYVKPLKQRRNSTDSKQNLSEEYDNFDERVFKNEINFERGKDLHNEKGREYFDEVKEAVRKMPKKAHSE